MKNKIGEVAGRVWKTLGEKGDIVYQALGWLAREDKINYYQKERRTFVSLSYDLLMDETFKRTL
jgi:hypothetical protein